MDTKGSFGLSSRAVFGTVRQSLGCHSRRLMPFWVRSWVRRWVRRRESSIAGWNKHSGSAIIETFGGYAWASSTLRDRYEHL